MKRNKKGLVSSALLPVFALTLIMLAGCGTKDAGGGNSADGQTASLDPNKTYYTVTWHYNNGEDDADTPIEADTRVFEPDTPDRDGYVFSGWYTDEALSEEYVFGSKIDADIELYANWEVVFTFEAEDVSFAGKSSPVFSGATSGTAMIVPDLYDRGASNGYYVMGLYSKTDATYDTTLEFNIVASEDMENAKIYLRLSAAYADMTINGSSYQVVVNGTEYNYSDISFAIPEGEDAYSAYVDFEDYLISSTVKLQAGDNVIQLVVNNADSLGGTTRATAPCVDALRISTAKGTLAWADGFPKTSNYSEDE